MISCIYTYVPEYSTNLIKFMQLFSACGGSRAGAGTDTSGGAWLPADLLAGGVLLAEALFAFASMTQFGVIFLYRDYKGDLASCDWQGFVNGLVCVVLSFIRLII